MAWSWRKTVVLLLLALPLAAFLVAFFSARALLADRYLGQPQVVGLPADFDPLARTRPYVGPHPSRKGRPEDTYSYPIPIKVTALQKEGAPTTFCKS